MILLIIIGLHFGIEGGLEQPVIGLDFYHTSGTNFNFNLGKNDLIHNVQLNLSLGGYFYKGKNPGYSLNIYNCGLMVKKIPWRFTPFFKTGIDYITRELDKNREWGFGFDYAIGCQINFYYENINIYPSFYYSGITDFKANAGCLGIKIGVAYEF
jgi:hypothetical protein|uniref:Outer membrane protein beta-barrel domain-containing protein n=1 Tax=candidate division WOR-3 bacterium TaxID=2052148 RepID=A0A7V3RFY6_UNCW3